MNVLIVEKKGLAFIDQVCESSSTLFIFTTVQL